MYPNPTVQYQQPAGAYGRQVDMSAVMLNVYMWLAMGLAVGFGIAAALGHTLLGEWAVVQAGGDLSNAPVLELLLSPAAIIITMVAYLGLAFAMRPAIQRVSIPVGAAMYLAFTAIFGVWTSLLFIEYGSVTIFAAFAATAGMFAVMSVIGYTTGADLSKLTTLLFTALIGLVLASVVNFFLHNPTLDWVISYAGVAIFCGLTAYDTQKIKRYGRSMTLWDTPDMEARIALYGAFLLFLDFANLFLFLLRIMGRRR
jgi:FtsH-binding integral membrane protein